MTKIEIVNKNESDNTYLERGYEFLYKRMKNVDKFRKEIINYDQSKLIKHILFKDIIIPEELLDLTVEEALNFKHSDSIIFPGGTILQYCNY